MGHEVIVYGMIDGATGSGENFGFLQERNSEVILQLPDDDEWPCLVRGQFALPAPWPQGRYLSQIIHFGLSLKDDPDSETFSDLWLTKFEGLLRRLYWWSAVVHIEREMFLDRTYTWAVTEKSLNMLLSDNPQPVQDWKRETDPP